MRTVKTNAIIFIIYKVPTGRTGHQCRDSPALTGALKRRKNNNNKNTTQHNAYNKIIILISVTAVI